MTRNHPRQLLLDKTAWKAYCALSEFYSREQLQRVCDSVWARARVDAKVWGYAEGTIEFLLLGDDIANRYVPKIHARVLERFAANPTGIVPFYVVKAHVAGKEECPPVEEGSGE